LAIDYSAIKAVIFDMDGLLVNSEPYWKIAEKQVFGELGLDLSDDLLRQVMGFRLSEVVKHWYNYQPWPSPDFEKTELDVLVAVTDLIIKYAEPMQGVYKVLDYYRQKDIPIALASSSARQLISAVLNKLNIENYFKFIHSAAFEFYGKPHPAIFLTVAEKLNILPENCLVFEDSINGVVAAKAAKMQCIAIPEPEKYTDNRFYIADEKYPDLACFFNHISSKSDAISL